ncbi:hypothetical protein [Listeria booriae]|uniref:hypothetical protein n=1 Tax=Listeria booriae TaxID=1552123 RepID=UPI00162A3CD6|nr:hypothetical protein [Listeria booriae]MBC2391332.1 hypothetical protein [Listeria booriae]
MRNRHHGACYRCGKHCKPGEGHFERHKGKWRHQHAACAVKYRHTNVHFQTNPIDTSQGFHLLGLYFEILKQHETAKEAIEELLNTDSNVLMVGINNHHTLPVEVFIERYGTEEDFVSWKRISK